MSDNVVDAAHGWRSLPPGRQALIAIVVLAVAVAVGLALGTTHPAVTIHTAVPSSAEGAISIEADGWTYSVPLDGVMWWDSTNSRHDSGRPTCLPPTGATRPVTFGSVEVTVNGTTWRPVVWVDCR